MRARHGAERRQPHLCRRGARGRRRYNKERFGVTATTYDPNPANNSVLVQTAVTSTASTFVVTNTNVGGPGSLREAITLANLDGGPADTIVFNIPGAGPHIIRPTQLSFLPPVTQPVVIDGTTQPGYAGTPLIEISGENADNLAGIVLNGTNSVVRGLAIYRFPLSGIALQGGGQHTVQGNFLGTNGAHAPGLAIKSECLWRRRTT